MSHLDDLTVCVTNFGRSRLLARAIVSLRNAGIRRVAVASVCPTSDGVELLAREAADPFWLSFDYNVVEADIGCNNTWTLAAYLARTKKVLVLHDDDLLGCEFGPAYENEIAPRLSGDVGMATWYGNFYKEDGRIEGCDAWRFGKSGVKPSKELLLRLGQTGSCSMSPILAILDRDVVIEATKEAEATLTPIPECIERPGMILGTELVVLIRQAERAPKWLYLDKVLSYYGWHEGSGSVKATADKGGVDRIVRGYDKARRATFVGPAFPNPKPKLIVVTSRRPGPPSTSRKMMTAAIARSFLFENFDAVDLPIPMRRLKRTLGEFPYVKDLLDLGASYAMPEDVVVYANDDVGFTVDAPAKILAGVERGLGATALPRRQWDAPHSRPLVRSVKNCPTDGGIDGFAMTAAWWAANRDKMPDMIIGREWWDAILGLVMEEAAGEPPRTNGLPNEGLWWFSRAYTDDVIWHEPHLPNWYCLRWMKADPGYYNRALALEFVTKRGNKPSMKILQDLQNSSR